MIMCSILVLIYNADTWHVVTKSFAFPQLHTTIIVPMSSLKCQDINQIGLMTADMCTEYVYLSSHQIICKSTG